MPFPLTFLGTDTTYSLPYRFEIVSEYPTDENIKDNTIYVCIEDEATLRYRVSIQKAIDEAGVRTLGLSTEGRVYHHEKLGPLASWRKRVEALLYRDTRYLGSDDFTAESILRSSSIQQALLSAANTKHKPDMPTCYPNGESNSILGSMENDRINAHGTTIIQTYVSLFTAIDDLFNKDKIRRMRAGMRIPFTIIEGPDTLGFKVGERIAEGLLKSLGSIAQGEQVLLYKTHSRGACEAIITSHELQFILNEIIQRTSDFDDESVAAVINKIRCLHTKLAFNKLLPSVKDDIRKLLNNCKRQPNLSIVRIDMSLLDPVPGNAPYLLPQPPMGSPFITWDDQRLFTLPPIVSNAMVTICANEHTECFAAVLPTAEDPSQTKIVRILVPGNHGTLPGNPHDQQSQPNPLDKNGDKTKTMQLIYLCNMVEFDQYSHREVTEVHGDLYQFIHDFKAKDRQGRVEKLLALHDKVLVDRAHYDHFNATRYAFLRQEGTLDPRRISEWFYGRNYRAIFFGTMGSKVQTTTYFGKQSVYLVNLQHAALFLASKAEINNFNFTRETIDSRFILALYNKLLHKPSLTEDALKIKEAVAILFFAANRNYIENLAHQSYCSEQAKQAIELLTKLSEPDAGDESVEVKKIFIDAANMALTPILNERLQSLKQLENASNETLSMLTQFYKTLGDLLVISVHNKECLTKLHSIVDDIHVLRNTTNPEPGLAESQIFRIAFEARKGDIRALADEIAQLRLNLEELFTRFDTLTAEAQLESSQKMTMLQEMKPSCNAIQERVKILCEALSVKINETKDEESENLLKLSEENSNYIQQRGYNFTAQLSVHETRIRQLQQRLNQDNLNAFQEVEDADREQLFREEAGSRLEIMRMVTPNAGVAASRSTTSCPGYHLPVSFDEEVIPAPTPAAPAHSQPEPTINSRLVELEFILAKKLMIKKLGLEIKPGVEASDEYILHSYVNGKTFSSNRNHKDKIREILTPNLTTAEYVRKIRQSFANTNALNPNGTLALILRYFSAKMVKESIDTKDSASFYNEIGELTITAVADKLGVSHKGLSTDDFAYKLVTEYITPTSFLKRFNNRHHSDILNSIPKEQNTAKGIYEAILNQINEKTEINPIGTLAMLLNALKQLSVQSVELRVAPEIYRDFKLES